MPKKRKSRGRAKGSKGSGKTVQCCACGKIVPRDKAKRVTRRISFIEPNLARELQKQGAYLGEASTVKYYCISCAVHRGIASPRKKDERRERTKRK